MGIVGCTKKPRILLKSKIVELQNGVEALEGLMFGYNPSIDAAVPRSEPRAKLESDDGDNRNDQDDKDEQVHKEEGNKTNVTKCNVDKLAIKKAIKTVAKTHIAKKTVDILQMKQDQIFLLSNQSKNGLDLDNNNIDVSAKPPPLSLWPSV